MIARRSRFRSSAALICLAAPAFGWAISRDCLQRLQYQDAQRDVANLRELIQLRDAYINQPVNGSFPPKIVSLARNLFQSVSRQSSSCPEVPIWLTWFQVPQSGGPPPGRLSLQSELIVRPPVKLPEQPVAPNETLAFTSTLINRFTLRHIVQSPVTPATMQRIAEIGGRHIPDFPAQSMAVKAIWHVIRKNEPPRRVGTWKAGHAKPNDTRRLPETEWPTCVWVVPADTAPPGERDCGKGRMGRFASVKEFFFIEYTPDLPIRFAGAPPLHYGDYLILVGLHITSRDIPDWVWATYWWTEDGRPTSGFGPISQLPHPWSRYDMNLTLSMRRPHTRVEMVDHHKRIYNPYLEARLTNGLASNCMTCHAIAAFPNAHSMISAEGRSQSLDNFERLVTTDFLWSVALMR